MGSSTSLRCVICALIVLAPFTLIVLSLPITWDSSKNGTDQVRIITREEWKARPPVQREFMKTPTPYVVIHHGGIAQYCYNQKTCSAIVRSYQDMHMDDRGWFDIGYSFVIGGDGNAYEGRGWNSVGAHSPGYNTQSIGICIIGDYSDILPNEAALRALSKLIDYGVSLGKISENYRMIGHRQARPTLCPGDRFYAYVQKNPRWTNSPIPKNGTTVPTRNDSSSNLVKNTCSRCHRNYANYICLWHKRLIDSISYSPEMNGLIIFLFTSVFCHVSFGAEEHRTPERPTIITRSQWGARAQAEPITDLKINPPPFVVIHHSATDSCKTQAICQAKVRAFQNHHIDVNNWIDIGYNFVVGEDGNVYEGRGWDKKGAHATAYNSKSIGICITGNFVAHEPNAAAIAATKKLIAYGVAIGKIQENYQLIGHLQAGQTECPGESLYNLIKTWPHWVERPST
ncbi:peptidoglycan recognition protein 3-like [Augochlora pura]